MTLKFSFQKILWSFLRSVRLTPAKCPASIGVIRAREGFPRCPEMLLRVMILIRLLLQTQNQSRKFSETFSDFHIWCYSVTPKWQKMPRQSRSRSRERYDKGSDFSTNFSPRTDFFVSNFFLNLLFDRDRRDRDRDRDRDRRSRSRDRKRHKRRRRRSSSSRSGFVFNLTNFNSNKIYRGDFRWDTWLHIRPLTLCYSETLNSISSMGHIILVLFLKYLKFRNFGFQRFGSRMVWL